MAHVIECLIYYSKYIRYLNDKDKYDFDIEEFNKTNKRLIHDKTELKKCQNHYKWQTIIILIKIQPL